MANFLKDYHQLKGLIASGAPQAAKQKLLSRIILASVKFCAASGSVDLISRVNGKEFFAIGKLKKRSRAINRALYWPDSKLVCQVVEELMRTPRPEIEATVINQALYTAAISFCASVDISKQKDQKTPGTFFEYLFSIILEAQFGVIPQTSIPVMNLDHETDLTVDLVFDTGHQRPKFHVPVKTSTRERVIQVWAHQRVLDGVYGVGRFLGMPIALAENKTDGKTNEVVEICLPNQWRLYQMHIAQLWRIAYLDLPAAYAQLSTVFPPVPVTTVGELLVGPTGLRSILPP